MENNMQLWRPRRPSASLDRRLTALAQAGAMEAREPGAREHGPILASRFPSTRCGAILAALVALLATVWLGTETWPGRARTGGETASLLAGLSNQTWHLALGVVELRHNTPLPILGWTNEGQISSTNDSLGESKTNVALR